MLESMIEGNSACKGICMNTFLLSGHCGFLHNVSITLVDKTDPSCLTKWQHYWIDTRKTKAPMGMNFDFDDIY